MWCRDCSHIYLLMSENVVSRLLPYLPTDLGGTGSEELRKSFMIGEIRKRHVVTEASSLSKIQRGLLGIRSW